MLSNSQEEICVKSLSIKMLFFKVPCITMQCLYYIILQFLLIFWLFSNNIHFVYFIVLSFVLLSVICLCYL